MENYCPNCISNNIIMSYDGYESYRCLDCKLVWSQKTTEEIKNIKRTKLIDKMLNVKNDKNDIF